MSSTTAYWHATLHYAGCTSLLGTQSCRGTWLLVGSKQPGQLQANNSRCMVGALQASDPGVNALQQEDLALMHVQASSWTWQPWQPWLWRAAWLAGQPRV